MFDMRYNFSILYEAKMGKLLIAKDVAECFQASKEKTKILYKRKFHLSFSTKDEIATFRTRNVWETHYR